MTRSYLYLILLFPINLDWRWLLPQTIVLKVPKVGDMDNWVYHPQGVPSSSALGEIKLVSSWSYSLQHLKWSYILVMEVLWKLQPEISCAQQKFLAYGILKVPSIPSWLALLTLLIMQQALLYQLLDLLHLLDLLFTCCTTLDPIQYILNNLNNSCIHNR